MSDALLGLLGALVGSGAFAALMAPRYVRQKAGADTAAVLNDTALELVQPLRDEVKELRGELTAYKERVRSLERQEREHAQLLAGHSAWDLLASQGRDDLPSPPPLFPPTRQERTRATDYPQ